MGIQGIVPECLGKNLAPENSDLPKISREKWEFCGRLRGILPYERQRRFHSQRDNLYEHYLNTGRFRPSKEPGEAKETVDDLKEIVDPVITMIANKITHKQTDQIAVKNNKLAISKNKRVDYQERNPVSLTKPGGKTPISIIMCLGKKKQKKKKS